MYSDDRKKMQKPAKLVRPLKCIVFTVEYKQRAWQWEKTSCAFLAY